MKISPQVKELSKGEIMAMADENDDLEAILEIHFGQHAFDTNFMRVDLKDMHECIQQAIDDGELRL